jgi:lysophospholipase L1-like esterase
LADESGRREGSGSRPRWQLASLAAALVVGALAGLDLALSALGARPPDDPLLFFARTREPRVDPFVEVAPGRLAIRPDWVNDGEGLRGRRGRRAGRQFLLPGFRPAELSRAKPARSLRVIGLGDSTSYGLFVGADAAFLPVLGREISAATGRPVETLNLGCAGFASDRVAALLPAALALDPDLVVVYVGHNEMLGGAEGPAAGLSGALRLRAELIARSSLVAWLDHWSVRVLRAAETERVREEVAALEAGEIPTFVPEDVPAAQREAPSAEFRAQAAASYLANLRRIAADARAAGVPLLFALPVANLRSPPGLSFHAPGFAAQAEFDAALRAAAALRESGRSEEALAQLERALALSPRHAQAHYLRGEALHALGREDEAREAWRAAVDFDGVTHRITTPLEVVFLEAMRETGAAWVDLRPVLQADLSDVAAKREFVDHVHPTAEGHARIAAALGEPARALLASRGAAVAPRAGEER